VRPISFKRHRFPADVIRHAVWLYFRFTLSFRDVEELLAQRGIGCCQTKLAGAGFAPARQDAAAGQPRYPTFRPNKP
jgi:transposase-like protein